MSSAGATTNEIMKTINTNVNDTNSKESTHEPTNEEDLLNLSEQYSDFTHISEASIKRTSTTYHVTVQEQPTIALLDTGANTSVISKKFKSLPQKPKLLKSHAHTVTSASGANLGSIGHCHLTFMFGNKYITNYSSHRSAGKFILGSTGNPITIFAAIGTLMGIKYITYNKYLCISMPSTDSRPVICIAGVFYLQSTSISVITV